MNERSEPRDGAENAPAGGPPAGTVPAAILGPDHVFETLAHPRRRYLCYTLLTDAEWSLTDLATKVAAYENGVAEDAVTDDQRESVYVSLHHAHVPKLVEEGVVVFDRDAETITPGPAAEQVLAALEGVGESVDAARETHALEASDDAE
ncbi:DUF7344 domain-containing protein [Haloarcula litorea]|uniref:DUF7344 domain-containing protein n=1 Tax=Haloarcula litorea TaxID=3032579 RepID=UPI0023E81DE5|nr:hypothetical protein [Halomicroarcula sp. GDY20]